MSSHVVRTVPWADSTLALLIRGYAWLPDQFRKSGGAPVRARLLGHSATALHGRDAVAFFYEEGHIARSAALPGPVLDTLFGRGAVHTLDGPAHRARKELFLGLLKDPRGVTTLAGHVTLRWRQAAAGWGSEPVVVFDEAARVLARSVCDWAGLPLSDSQIARMAADCTAMVNGFAVPGPRHLRARHARARQETLLADLVVRTRDAGGPEAPGEASATVLEAVARHRDADGALLDAHTAAVELLNVIRPTVAIAWFTAFAAHALHRWPQHRTLLREDGDGRYARAFAHEVRRFYPFAPFVGGFAAADLDFHGTPLTEGTLVLLDLYGHHHDPHLFPHPYRFDPHRFLPAHPGLADLIPQGGGDPVRGHRCPGEDITVAALAVLAAELAHLDMDVPEQDLTISLTRIPTLPHSGFVFTLSPSSVRRPVPR
ncbi:cytochrome P450 [Streptomyces sp. NPDC058646]|uniref:cytochrome P450 n=1 Tax=Streptomyces sp. NPDC058646 TaxID=3346574 RepID=UPI003665A34F